MSLKLRMTVTKAASKFKHQDEFHKFFNESGIIDFEIKDFNSGSLENKELWYDALKKHTFAYCIISLVYGGVCGEDIFPEQSYKVQEKFEYVFSDSFWKTVSVGMITGIGIIAAYKAYLLYSRRSNGKERERTKKEEDQKMKNQRDEQEKLEKSKSELERTPSCM